jgi:hypothetical protein
MKIKYGQREGNALLSGRKLEAATNCLKLPQYAVRTHGNSAHGKRQNCAELSASTSHYNHADCMVMTRTTRPYSDSQN